jgi:iron complex transport system substrate-binding protein
VKKKEKMKTKTKAVVLIEIALVLCSMLLVALPVIATDQTTQKVSANAVTRASEDDFTLGIYGNANEDDTIDMRDTTYIKLVIFGKKHKNDLADANYDGKVSMLDVGQVKLIILGKEKELTFIDTAGGVVTVLKPVERIIPLGRDQIEPLRSIGVADKIIGVGKYSRDPDYFPEFKDHPLVSKDDLEGLIVLEPDIIFTRGLLYKATTYDIVYNWFKSNAPHIPVVGFDCRFSATYPSEVKKLGYIFERREEAEEFLDFYQGCINTIKEQVEGNSEEDKPKVYFAASYKIDNPSSLYSTCGRESSSVKEIVDAGGKYIFDDLTGDKWGIAIDAEELIERDPDIIVAQCSGRFGYGLDVSDTADLEAARNDILSRPELQKMSAVKNKRIYIITHGAGGLTSTPKNFVASAYLAKWFYPDLFDDLEPRAIHQEYITRFQGLDIDLDKKGVFVYPEPS